MELTEEKIAAWDRLGMEVWEKVVGPKVRQLYAQGASEKEVDDFMDMAAKELAKAAKRGCARRR